MTRISQEWVTQIWENDVDNQKKCNHENCQDFPDFRIFALFFSVQKNGKLAVSGFFFFFFKDFRILKKKKYHINIPWNNNVTDSTLWCCYLFQNSHLMHWIIYIFLIMEQKYVCMFCFSCSDGFISIKRVGLPSTVQSFPGKTKNFTAKIWLVGLFCDFSKCKKF